jgi:hypothetical protein
MSSAFHKSMLLLLAGLAMPHVALAERTRQAEQQCPPWETLRDFRCAPCPASQQTVRDGQDACASDGGLSMQDDDDDEEQK